jgi:hypothetical protein
LESDVDRVNELDAAPPLRDVAVVLFDADELGIRRDVGRVDGFTGNRLGETLRLTSVPVSLAAFSAGGGIVGFRKERLRWREDDMAAVWDRQGQLHVMSGAAMRVW